MNQEKDRGVRTIGITLTVLLVTICFFFWQTINQPPAPTEPAPTTQYDPAPADPEKNAPGENFFDYIRSEVPKEQRERVSLASLFSLDTVKMNQYFDQSVYRQVGTKIEIASIYRARATTSYAALTWPENWFTKIVGLDGQILEGSELATITAGDAFLIIGTDIGQALGGITNITVDDDNNTVTVTVEIEPKGLAVGLAIAAEENSPQVEHATVATPNTNLDSWLMIRDKLPSESELNNLGLKTVARESLWLMLHQDAPEIWGDIVESIETPGEDHAYDLLAPWLQKAFCSKLDSFQTELIAQGKNLELLSCNDPENPIEIVVVFQTVMPTGPNGEPGLEFIKMIDSGYFVQTPDFNYSVEP